MRWFWLVGSISFFVLSTLTYSASAQDECAGLVLPHLQTNITARAKLDNGIGLVLRDGAGTNLSDTHVITTLPEGVIFTVLSEPICKDGFLWWQVRLPDSREGFIAEGGMMGMGYYVEPYEVGATIFSPDAANSNQLNQFFVDTNGNLQTRAPFTLTSRVGSVADLWQSFEIGTADQILADRLANCPDQLPATFAGLTSVNSLAFSDNARAFYPSRDGSKILIFRDYLVGIPDCTGQMGQYGTTYVNLLSATGEEIVFPFSQRSDPPPSQFCQTPLVPQPDRATYIDEVVWSGDGRYVALGVRYLRNSTLYPCAFYHIFVINTGNLTVTYAGEGRRIGFGDNRLYYLRSERSDPNVAGIEKMFSARPDGSDPVQVIFPDDASWLPGLIDTHPLPWMESGEGVLVCRDETCAEIMTFHLADYTLSPPIPAPPDALPDLKSVHYVMGDTRLLWLGSDGRLWLQMIDGENAGEIEQVAAGIGAIVAVQPLVTGIGAVLIVEDGSYFYYDVLGNVARQLDGI